MSIFGIGGQIGFAVGPLFTTALVLAWGIKGTLALAVPPVLVGVFLACQGSRFSTYSGIARKKPLSPTGRTRSMGPFFRLSGVVFCRSIMFYAMNTFVPLYWINVLHQSNAAGGTALTLLFRRALWETSSAGAWGYLRPARGHPERLFRAPPLLPLFLSTDHVALATVILVAVGLIHFLTYSPLVVLAQKYLPRHVGLASG